MSVENKDQQNVVQDEKPNIFLMAVIGIFIYFILFKKI